MILATVAISACGGGGGGGGTGGPKPPPPGSYDLQAAMLSLIKGGVSSPVTLSGTALANGISSSFTGTGSWTLNPGVGGMFNGTVSELQTQTIAGTITIAGQAVQFSSSVVTAHDSATGAITGQEPSSSQSQNVEFDVAQAPLVIPTTIDTAATVLGTLSRYSDSTLSIVLGTVQVSVAVSLIPVDPGSPEVVQFTNKVYDTNQALVETDTFSYNLTQDSVASLNGATSQTAQGTLTVTVQ